MKKERITFEDRIVASSVILFASFITALFVWLLVFLCIGKMGELSIVPFSFVIYTTAIFTMISFIYPNKPFVYIAWIWEKIFKFIKFLI